MIKLLFPVLIAFVGTSLMIAPVSAQSDGLRVAIANMNQDVSLLGQQMKTLRLEMEAMSRENAHLRAQVAAVNSNRDSNQDTQNQISQLSAAIETLRRECRQGDEVQKQQIITEVSRQIDALAKETQGALNALAQAVDAQPQVSVPVRFSADYPKTGTTYTVRSGDTLSQIARAHGSSIKHIQDANKIVNPAKDLRVGQTIFIPISE